MARLSPPLPIIDCIAGYRNGFQAFGASVLILNQSYFMSLFFFISGYFTPSSFDRKGRHAFVYDKLKRLGIPFLGFTFVLGPLLVDGLCGQLFIKVPHPPRVPPREMQIYSASSPRHVLQHEMCNGKAIRHGNAVLIHGHAF